mmetsp:Transcript_5265/g.15574  ORF Transcript_5265/g.15574 Transcript_5265/m.15574 type:complete len:214 (-) Transcript_5265:1782-2423(-)
MASEAWPWSSRARSSRDSRSPSRWKALSFVALASSSARTSCSSAATRRLRTADTSLSAPLSLARRSQSSVACLLPAAASCSSWNLKSATSTCTMLLLFRKCDASPALSLISSCRLVMRMLRSMFSFFTCRSSSSSSASLLLTSILTSSVSTASVWASVNCCFSCSNMARWLTRVFRSSISPRLGPAASPLGVIEGRAFGAALVSMRERSSLRS